MSLPKPPYTAKIAKEPRQIFITAEGKEIARLDVSFDDLDMSQEQWEQRLAIADLFIASPAMLEALRNAEEELKEMYRRLEISDSKVLQDIIAIIDRAQP